MDVLSGAGTKRNILTMPKMNCWEFMECEREMNGNKAGALGTCPAASSKKFDGVNRGKNSGRMCWKVAGTLCGSVARGTFAEKFKDCAQCPFLKVVEAEEGDKFVLE
jgi:hypothetical protein